LFEPDNIRDATSIGKIRGWGATEGLLKDLQVDLKVYNSPFRKVSMTMRLPKLKESRLTERTFPSLNHRRLFGKWYCYDPYRLSKVSKMRCSGFSVLQQ
jgi:hypothetical protein